MARKGLLASISNAEYQRPEMDSRADYVRRGASRSMLISIDEMAENAKWMVSGEAIVSIDPSLIDVSFVADRIDDNEEDFLALKEAVKHQGQASPILVRPHPSEDGRYMTVFGHRRLRVARELGIPVRAVVKNMEDIAHIIAQGQENGARANLSFIEKALFARKLLDMGQGKDTIKVALSLDDTLLSRMLSIAEVIPAPVIAAIGAAKSIGRDRWEDLKRILLNPAKSTAAREIVAHDEFLSKVPDERFAYLLSRLKSAKKTSREVVRTWSSEDRRVAADYRTNGKAFSLSLKSKDGSEFGQYISSNLEALYRAFRESKSPATKE